MNFPSFHDYNQFVDSSSATSADDSLNALGQIIESIQLPANDFSYRQLKDSICACCGLPIYEQFMLRVQSHLFHESCANCSECGISLDSRCFEREGRLYCHKHYSRNACAGCKQGILPTDMVYKLKADLIFHVQCHLCYQCGKKLEPGDHVFVDQESKSVACASHFISSDQDAPSTSTVKENRNLPPIPQYPFEMYAFGELYSDNGKFMKRRGPRTTIKQHQLDVLNRVFANSPKPSKHVRAKLAAETGLSMRVIQVWMQNRRSKERRLKHLCNYLRHYEEKGILPNASQLAFQQSETDQDYLMLDQLPNFGELSDENSDNIE